jgi:hypothetical protein
LAIVVGFAGLVLTVFGAPRVTATACPPTDADMLGPFYVAGAPALRRTGEGLAVQGVARSTRERKALPGAKLEWWSANTKGPVHLHVKVSAPGHKALVTQVYPKPGQKEVALDFVLLAD